MPGPVMLDPTPTWLKKGNESVFDSPMTKALRILASLIGADDPQSQVMGLAAPMETGPVGGLAGAVKKGIKAYHGSPHDFDKFSLEKIGTGEGAQAYGHGLYFAENEGTAKSYRDALSFAQHSGTPDQAQLFFDELASAGTIGGKVPFGRNATLYSPEQMREAFVSGRINAFDFPPAIQKRVEQKIAGKGRMYEVNLNADPDAFLDWDRPLSEQSEPVRQALRKQRITGKRWEVSAVGEGSEGVLNDRYVFDDPVEAREFINKLRSPGNDYDVKPINASAWEGELNGQEAYDALRMKADPSGSLWNNAAPTASAMLKSGGVKGVKYLDQGSRGWTLVKDKNGHFLRGFGSKDQAEAALRQLPASEAPRRVVKMPYADEWAIEGQSGTTRNYVVFDDSIIDIMKKYGIVAAATAALARQRPQGADQ